jgi:hypothetical protein
VGGVHTVDSLCSSGSYGCPVHSLNHNKFLGDVLTHQEDTSYAVRVLMNDGTTFPETNDDLDWQSLKEAKRIAANIWDAGSKVKNGKAIGVEIIDMNYSLKQKAMFDR